MNKFLLSRAFNPTHQRVSELRGSLALDMLMRHTPLGAAVELANPDEVGGLMMSPTGIVYMDLDLAYNNTVWADEIADHYRVIVDVHFSVFRPTAAFCMDRDGGISEDDTHAAVMYYSRKDVQEWVRGFLHRVPAVTAPHADTYRELKKLNPNSFLLPDVVSKSAAMRFCRRFLVAMNAASYPDASGWKRFADRTKISLSWPLLSLDLRNHLEEAVAKP